MNPVPAMPTIPADTPAQLVLEVADPAYGPLGVLVIDRVVGGAACGGVRFAEGVSAGEIESIARTMTLKWAILNIPMGGAKAGIRVCPEQLGIGRRELMAAFGRAIEPLVLRSVYWPCCDLGTTNDDLSVIMQAAGRPLQGEQIDSSLGTAYTVRETILRVARHHNRALAGLRVAIEGFGKVGGELARLLAADGAHLMAVSTVKGALISTAPLDIQRLLDLRERHAGDFVLRHESVPCAAAADLFAADVDVLVPGARSGAIDVNNCDRVRAPWIVPVSNAPLTAEAETRLLGRGVVVVSDFLANCGGLLAVDLRAAGFDIDDLRFVVSEAFGELVTRILRRAETLRWPVGQLARELAWRNHRSFLAESVGPTTAVRLKRMLAEEGFGGIWPRIAWRLRRRLALAPPATRRSAVRRYMALRFGPTERRLAEVRG